MDPATPIYNCIAWSGGITTKFLTKMDIDKDYGNNNGVFEISDMDAFYFKTKKLTPTATGPEDAQVMYYSGYHAATRKSCFCGKGKWIMYESKCGSDARIEHVWNQINSRDYGTPTRFYK